MMHAALIITGDVRGTPKKKTLSGKRFWNPTADKTV